MALEQHSPFRDGRAVRQPPRFRPAEGVRAAWAIASGPFSRTPKGRSPAQKAGLRYERQAQEHLSSLFPDLYTPSQWFNYIDSRGVKRFCQPDGVLHLGSMLVIFEIKIRFTSDAWWQLRRLYAPVLTAVYRPKALGLVILSRNYDPFVPFPESHELIGDIERWIIRRDFTYIGVFPWRN